MAVNYSGLVPVVVQFVKEQQEELEELEKTVEELQNVSGNNDAIKSIMDKMDAMQNEIAQLQNENQSLINQMAQFDIDLQKCCLAHQGNGVTGSTQNLDDKAHLAQNVPNPYNQRTIIKYYLPKSSA